MFRELNHKKGSPLLEMMIVLLFIGIMAGCNNPTGTNPSSSNATAKNFVVVTKQWEAKMILKQIYAMEVAYHQKHDFYWPNGATACASASYYPDGFATLGIRIPPFARYTYCITATFTTFMAAAASSVLDSDPTVDVWTINDLGQLIVTSDDAAD